MSSIKGPDIAKLGPNNYPQWSGEMQAWLRAAQLWRLVSGKLKIPEKTSPITGDTTEDSSLKEELHMA